MSSIPLPALDLKPIQQPDPMGDVSKLMMLKQMMGQQQLQQGQLQLQQQNLKNVQATTAAFKNWDPKSQSYDDLAKSVLDNGGDATAAMAVTQHGLQVQQAVQTLSKDQLENFQNKHKAVGDALEALVDPKAVPDEQLHAAATQKVADLAENHIIDPQTAQQSLQLIQSTADPTVLRQKIDQVAKVSMGMQQVAAQQKTQAETDEAKAKTRSDNANAAMKEIETAGLKGLTPELASQQVDSVFDPKDPQTAGQNRLLKSRALGLLAQGDLPGAKQALQEGFQNALAVQKDVAEATNPAVQQAKLHLATMEKSAEQAISDGDPKAAAQLLVSGAVAPSQLISSRRPAFAQQAFTLAQQMQPGWNAQKADADYKVASSPQNVAFFGSAKSLTDKGGTLDQLKDAAKDIPANEFPVFNSVADAIKASTGSGPIAKYAALALGVADDYSKVMGGGQGSDTSRTQALNIIAAKQSPEQRAASIEGIRGAVGSQTNSRIGNNTVLQKMYGVSPSQTQQAATKTYQNHTYTRQPDGSWKLTQ